MVAEQLHPFFGEGSPFNKPVHEAAEGNDTMLAMLAALVEIAI
jgi:hypothetical protein